MSSYSLSDKRSAFVDARTGANVLSRIMKMALEFRWRLIFGILTTVAAAVSQLFIPRLMGQSVDDIYTLLGSAISMNSDTLLSLLTPALLLLLMSVSRGVFMAIHNQQGEALGQNIGYSLRLSYYKKLQQLSFSYHDRIHTGDLMTRGMLDVEGIRMFISTGVLRTFYLTILIGFGAYMLISADLIMGLISLSFVPIVGWRATVSRLTLRESWYQLQKRMSILTRVMDENLGGIRVVRAFVSETHEMDKFDRASHRALVLNNKRINIRVHNQTVMTFVYYLAMGAVLLVGGTKVLDGQATVGKLTEFLAFMTILQLPVRQIGMMVNAYARASSSGDRLFEILDTKAEIHDQPEAPILIMENGQLEFKDVCFSYQQGTNKIDVLKGISFTVGPGQTLGIVGPPGAGKSTIAHLIPRHYDVSKGSISIDKQDIRDIKLASLRAAVGVIQQDSFIFTSALEKNVAYGDPWAERERIQAAASSAELDTYIRQLPFGYDTLVGERGVSLSGGQRQRLSIARSVMLRPPIMVFDDSTAAIDAGTEQRIRKALKNITKQSATIIIAHRLSSLMHATEIIFLESGRIIERGNHDTLLATGGKYADLYNLQTQSNS